MCCLAGCGHVERTLLESLVRWFRDTALGNFLVWSVISPYGEFNPVHRWRRGDFYPRRLLDQVRWYWHLARGADRGD